MASGHPFYIDYVPKNNFPFANQDTRLANNTKQIQHDPAMTPDHIALGARPDQGPFTSAGVQRNYRNYIARGNEYELYLQKKGFMPLANTFLYLSTYQPPNRFLFGQGVQPARSKGKQKSGNAPTEGVYTGYYLESYSSYGGVEYSEDY